MVDYIKEDGKILVKGEINADEVLKNIELSIKHFQEKIVELEADKAKLLSLK